MKHARFTFLLAISASLNLSCSLDALVPTAPVRVPISSVWRWNYQPDRVLVIKLFPDTSRLDDYRLYEIKPSSVLRQTDIVINLEAYKVNEQSAIPPQAHEVRLVGIPSGTYKVLDGFSGKAVLEIQTENVGEIFPIFEESTRPK